MDVSKKLFCCLIWLITLYAIGILLFTKGFLLTRFVLKDNSSCTVELPNVLNVSPHSNKQSGCWMKQYHKKAVVIVIDALRFDFVEYNTSIPASEVRPYENKLKTIHNLLENDPEHSKLYRFMADPPTTTLQRLKGLTTGSLPTFIDVASNFDSSAISEDNIVDQLVKQNKSIVFMGDDTWVNLFPKRFKRQYSFPSFNVKDLHTVDNGVIENLVPELLKDDWDVLIGHFLGVDHCGHRYGPNHPAMTEKLQQMDAVIKSVMESLDDDTILFVMGDHGMTRTGDHGGDSWDELQAALFVYSPTKLESTKMEKYTYSTVSQIDLVPTLSLLLGTPIPFSNLGTIIPDLFITGEGPSLVSIHYQTVEALQLNAHQVRHFIRAYAATSDEFPVRALHKLETKFHAIEALFSSIRHDNNLGNPDELLLKLKEIEESYVEYLLEVKVMCQDMWAKFDLSLMILGIVLVVCTLVHSLYWILTLGDGRRFRWQPVVIGLVASLWTMILIIMLAHVHLSVNETVISLVIGCFLIVIFGIIAVKLTLEQPLNLSVDAVVEFIMHIDVIPLVIVIASSISVFSNSYVVFEDSVSAYFLQSVIAYNGYCVVSKLYDLPKKSGQQMINKKSKELVFDLGRYLTSPVAICIMLVLFTNMLIRISSSFRGCREEQWDCEQPTWLQSLSSLPDNARKYKNIRYFLSIGCLACFSIFMSKWLRFCGNLNGLMISVFCIKFLLPSGLISLGLYWALQALPSKILDDLPLWQTTLFPRIVYCIVLMIFISTIWSPLCLFLVKRSNREPLPFTNAASDNVLPQMFSHLKENWRKHMHSASTRAVRPEESDDKPPLVYGLATVFSSSHLVLVSAVVLLLFMLLGDGLALSMLLYLAVMVALLEINASLVHVRKDTGFYTPWSSILAWSLLASEHFFATGHQTVVTSIQWQAAFHGFQGDFNYYIIPISLILTNTFATFIISVVCLPLLLFWPRVRQGVIYLFEKSKRGIEAVKDTRGEFMLHEHSDKLWSGLFQLIVGFIIIQGVKLSATMCCAMLHRRHLMVWKIFAPRFMFEGATFLLLGPLCILVYCFVVRVNLAIKNWVKQIES